MTFTESIKTCFQKYIDFSGRASRSEYWWFFLFTFLLRVLIGWIPGVGFILTLVLLLPTLAVTVRRLHDINRSGWWLLLPIGLTIAALVSGAVLSLQGMILVGVAIAVVGSLAGFLSILVFLVQPGDVHDNQYGPDPLQPRQDSSGSNYTHPGDHYSPQPQVMGYAEPGDPPAQAQPSTDADPGQRSYCAQCGTQLQPEARFCTYCGVSI